MNEKKKVDTSVVKDAYAACQGGYRPRTAVGLMDLAEKIAGQSLYGEQGRTSRQGAARKVLHWSELEASVEQLVADGWLRPIDQDEARALRLLPYWTNSKTRLWVSQVTYDEAQAVKARTARNEARSLLLTRAQKHILAEHADEVGAEYSRLCRAEGLDPTVEGGEVNGR